MNSFTLNLFYKIKSSCPRFLLGQERIRSCGTTQIDANCVHSAHTSNNARSLITGGVPVAVTWPKPFTLPCWSPFTRSLPAAITPPAALLEVRSPCYSSSSLVCVGLLGMVTVYSQNGGLSSVICEKQYIISDINSYHENEGRSIVFFCTLCYNG